MERIENEDFVVKFEGRAVRIWMKGPGVEALINPLSVGMSIGGGGHHPLLAHGRDFTLLILDRELIGEAYLWEGLR
ncbi:hypothetical protein KW800_02155 [Candidatus Parcubacteria bacterium]|nr:hypothetical protein [Candidatus Parcubacteria bacterium]